jgi:hypothetical protein
MRDQGLCRNAVYNFDPLEAPINGPDGFFQGNPEFLKSSYGFTGEGERMSYVQT